MTRSPNITVEALREAGMLVPCVEFADEIARFVELDRLHPPEPGGILFLGDSDIRFWSFDGRFAEDFAGLPVLNRGFGGARTWESLLYFRETVLPARPRVIVYCCGDNDIARLRERGPASAVTGFRLFMERVRAHAPSVRTILYMAIHPSPGDEPLWGFIEQANTQLRPLCAASGLAQYVDYVPLLLDARGRPRAEYFRPDRLHFTPDFYRILGAFFRPRLEAELAAGNGPE